MLEVLERQRIDDLHDCAQVYVSRDGEVLLDAAIGESRPGRPLRTDDVMLWYSSGKPLTTVAILRLWERGRLGLDDPIAEYVDGWGNGKEHCTIRHVLIHTGGFPMYGNSDFDTDLPSAEVLAHIAATPAAWEPGTKAGYHPVTGWKVLGAVVEAVDGRPIETYLREEILTPIGARRLVAGRAPRSAGASWATVWCRWRGRGTGSPWWRTTAGCAWSRTASTSCTTCRGTSPRQSPGRRCAAPRATWARSTKRCSGSVRRCWNRARSSSWRAVHRHDLRDAVFGFDTPWGLGVTVDLSGGAGRRAFGHGGMASSRGFADPECGLVAVVVCNGLPNPIAAEQRLVEITDAVYTSLGEGVTRFRRPL